jgi:endonuclease/exonuclease/phosphatase family metal-dependent hydrolase
MHEAFLREHLKGYGFVCAYRSRKGTQEGLMIAYSLASFEPVRDGYFWISDTPERESKDWGTAFPRIALYVTLQNKQSGRQCTIMDVHLDHVSEEARQEGMRVLLEQKQALGIESMVLLGDMNDHDDTLMYTQAVSGGLVDAKEVASSVYEGSGATYHKYGKKLNAKRIDYFFLTPDLDVLSYAVIDRTVDGVYPSDHFPLVIRLAPTAW